LATVASTYLSINIDSGSLFNLLDFTDPVLIALTTNIARASPTQLRIGGGAADNLLFTGVGGLRGNCTGLMGPNIDTCVDASMWDSIAAFSDATGVEIVWDLAAAIRDSTTGRWNSTNARSLFSYVAGSASAGQPVAWQLGNEVEDWYKRHPPLNVSGAALAEDYAALRALLGAFPAVAQTVYGIDACCEERRAILADFAAAAAAASPPLVSASTVHAYPIPRAPDDSCIPGLFLSKAAALGVVSALRGYAAALRPLTAAGVPIVLGETATSAHGGCANASDAFVAGFTFMLELGAVGEVAGVAQLNRQDLVGFSSDTGPSNYALLGPAGWRRDGRLLAPRPDYFTALLFKHLAGAVVLNSSYGSADDPAGAADGVDAHVWCARTGAGAAVLTFTNLLPRWVNVTLPAAAASARRTEYVLTAVAAPQPGPPPPELFQHSAFLNGRLLTVNADGTLPQWPLPGKSAQGPIALPPWSYGLIELLDAGASGACTGCTGRC
jgi:hypothetical protein